jgi:hypothetical protein
MYGTFLCTTRSLLARHTPLRCQTFSTHSLPRAPPRPHSCPESFLPWSEASSTARSVASCHPCFALAAFTSYSSHDGGAAVAAVRALRSNRWHLHRGLLGVLRGRMAPWPFVGPSPVALLQRRDSGRFSFRSAAFAAKGAPPHLPAKGLLSNYIENGVISNGAGASGEPVESFSLLTDY